MTIHFGIFKRIMNGIARTTNCKEAWNRNLNFKSNIKNDKFGKFMEY